MRCPLLRRRHSHAGRTESARAGNVALAIAYYMLGAPTVSLFQLAIFAGAIVVFFIITVMFTKSGDMEITEEVEA